MTLLLDPPPVLFRTLFSALKISKVTKWPRLVTSAISVTSTRSTFKVKVIFVDSSAAMAPRSTRSKVGKAEVKSTPVKRKKMEETELESRPKRMRKVPKKLLEGEEVKVKVKKSAAKPVKKTTKSDKEEEIKATKVTTAKKEVTRKVTPSRKEEKKMATPSKKTTKKATPTQKKIEKKSTPSKERVTRKAAVKATPSKTTTKKATPIDKEIEKKATPSKKDAKKPATRKKNSKEDVEDRPPSPQKTKKASQDKKTTKTRGKKSQDMADKEDNKSGGRKTRAKKPEKEVPVPEIAQDTEESDEDLEVSFKEDSYKRKALRPKKVAKKGGEEEEPVVRAPSPTPSSMSKSSKVPVYMRTTQSPPPPAKDAKKSSLAQLRSLIRESKRISIETPVEESKNTDVYDMDAGEFGPEPEVKKKKKRKAKKQQARAILAFGNEDRNKVAPILKELKNLKTPVQQQQNQKQRIPLKTLGQPPPLPPPVIVMSPENSLQSSVGFTRDCDDFLPSINNQPSSINNSARSEGSFLHPQSVVGQPPSRSPLQRYKTPAIPKHVSKREGKVSTPRVDGKLETALSNKELVKMCFGFDDSSEDEAADNDSILDISPVKSTNDSNSMRSLMSPSSSVLSVGGRSICNADMTLFKAAPKNEGPWRCTLFADKPRKRPLPPPPRRKKAKKVMKAVEKAKEQPRASLVLEGMDENASKVDEPSIFDELAVTEGDEKENENVETSEEKNAFTVLKESSSNLEKKGSAKGKKEASKSVIAEKPKKQSLIYEMVRNDGEVGERKQLKSRQKKNPENER